MRKKDIQKLPREALFQLSLQRGKIHCYTAHALYAQQLLQTDMLVSMRNLELSSRDFKISLIANERILFMKAKLGI